MIRPFMAVLAVCLLIRMPVHSQSAPQRLHLIALEGDRAVNYIPLQMATAPIIEVRDENDRPVVGAKVTFSTPASGASATFLGGGHTYTGVSDFRGQVAAAGYAINNTAGQFPVQITATYLDRTGRLTISQTNSMESTPVEAAGSKRSNKWKWILLGVGMGAGAGLGVYFGTRSTSPISVGVGPVVIGAPR